MIKVDKVIVDLEARLSDHDERVIRAGARLRMGWDRVYFVLAPDAGLVKIGTSWRLPLRLAEIETMSPVSVQLIGHVSGGADRERTYHEMFAAARSHGEWFRYTPEVRDRIAIDCMIDTWNTMDAGQRLEFLRIIEGGAQ